MNRGGTSNRVRAQRWWCAAVLLPWLGAPTAGGQEEAELRDDPRIVVAPSNSPEAAQQFRKRLDAEGIRVDLARREVQVRGSILRHKPSPNYPIEYALVTEKGFTHEAFGVVRGTPSLINACLLWIGLEPGVGRHHVLRDPPPSEEDVELGLESPSRLVSPEGDRVFCYVRWRDDSGQPREEILEDLLFDVRNEGLLPLRGFVYLGSRFMTRETPAGPQEVYLADYEGNIATIYPDRALARNCLFDVYSTDAVPYRFADVNPDRVPPPDALVDFVFTPHRKPETRPLDLEPKPVPEPCDSAVPLAESSRNPYLQQAPSTLLKRIGKRKLSELRGMIARGRPELREVVAGLLGVVGKEGVEKDLLQLLRLDRSDDVRLSAAFACVELGTDPVIAGLVELLDNPWWKCREDAYFALQLFSGENHGRSSERWRQWNDGRVSVNASNGDP